MPLFKLESTIEITRTNTYFIQAKDIEDARAKWRNAEPDETDDHEGFEHESQIEEVDDETRQ